MLEATTSPSMLVVVLGVAEAATELEVLLLEVSTVAPEAAASDEVASSNTSTLRG